MKRRRIIHCAQLWFQKFKKSETISGRDDGKGFILQDIALKYNRESEKFLYFKSKLGCSGES